MVIHIVIAPGPFVLGAYTNPDSAHLHARMVTGCSVVQCDLLDQLPPEVREDVYIAEVSDFDEDATPVEATPVPPAGPKR